MLEIIPATKQVLELINANIGKQIYIDFNKLTGRKKTLRSYMSNAVGHGFIKRIKTDTYEVIKPVTSTSYLARSPNEFKLRSDEAAEKAAELVKFNNNPEEYRKFTRAELRKIVNKHVGLIIDSSVFNKRNIRKGGTYLQALHESGHVQRVGIGKYKVLKKVRMKRKKDKKINKRFKDVSMIPTILNSSSDGLLMDQIEKIYKRITPIDKQVNRNYLYRMLAFATKSGVVFHKPPTSEDVINHVKGPMAKRSALVNPDISEEEWEKFVDEFRLFYQYKKKNKNGRRSKIKTVKDDTSKSKSILSSFTEDRNNPNKQFVEDYFLDKVKEHIGSKKVDCFAVTGPDYNRHINKLFNSIAKEVVVCELEADVFNTIYRKAQACPYYLDNKVSLINCDVDKIIPSDCHYIDLDLMASITFVYDSILKQIKPQRDTLKFITFTCSTRKDGGSKNRLQIFKNLLHTGFETKLENFEGGHNDFGIGVEVFNPSQHLNYCLKHNPYITNYGRIKDIDIFTYSDNYPMLSVLIAYV